MNFYDITFTARDLWLLGIVGALCLILLYQWLSDSRVRHSERLSNGKKLRSVFFNDLLNIKNGINSDFAVNPHDYLENHFPVHEVVALDFANSLGWFKRKRFLIAWYSYCGKEDKNSKHNLYQYSSSGHDSEEKTRRKTLAIQNIEHLLSFIKT